MARPVSKYSLIAYYRYQKDYPHPEVVAVNVIL